MKFSAAACIVAACFFMFALPIVVGRSAAALEQDGATQIDEPVAAPGTPTAYKTPTNDLSVSWSWAAPVTDSEVSYEYAFVTAGEQPTIWLETTARSVSTTAPSDGTYRLYVRTVADSGLKSDTAIGEVVVDTTPPTVSLETPTPTAPGSTVELRGVLKNFSDMTLTIGNRVYTLENATYDTQTGMLSISIATTGFAPGSYGVTLFARDAAGNSATATTELKVTTPTATVGTVTPPTSMSQQQPASVPAAISPAAVHEAGRATAPLGQNAGESVATTQAPIVSPVESTLARAINSDANQGRFVGLAWYWWLLAVGGLSASIWWVRRLTRQQLQRA